MQSPTPSTETKIYVNDEVERVSKKQLTQDQISMLPIIPKQQRKFKPFHSKKAQIGGDSPQVPLNLLDRNSSQIFYAQSNVMSFTNNDDDMEIEEETDKNPNA
jgi:hypothetical protein